MACEPQNVWDQHQSIIMSRTNKSEREQLPSLVGAGAGAVDCEQATDMSAAYMRPRKTTTLNEAPETTAIIISCKKFMSSLLFLGLFFPLLAFSLLILQISREKERREKSKLQQI